VDGFSDHSHIWIVPYRSVWSQMADTVTRVGKTTLSSMLGEKKKNGADPPVGVSFRK
jgi:hypothetical protein